MDAAAFKIGAGLALSVGGLLGLWLLRGTLSSPRSNDGPPAARPQARAETISPHRGRLRLLLERSRFSQASFDRDCVSLARRLLGHPHYAGRDGAEAFARVLEATCHALGYRQAMLLPPHAPAEDIEPRSFRWTYGVFVAAMLHELHWHVAPSQGSLRQILGPWVEPRSLAWLLEDEDLAEHLQRCFDVRHGATVIHRLVAQGRMAAGLESDAPMTCAPTPALQTQPGGEQAREALDEAPAAVEPGRSDEPAVLPAAAEPAASMDDARSASVKTQVPVPVIAPVVPASQDHLASGFMQWLSAGLAGQTILCNAPEARVHFVSDGMLLVAPGVFQEYAAASATGAGVDLSALGREVQKAVCNQGWHLRGPQNAQMHRYRLQRAATPAGAVLKGVVIQAPERFITAMPEPNPSLARLM